jgi:malate dehydrogenase (oxaloacetate-decarboxylating)
MSNDQAALKQHKILKGKLEVKSKDNLNSKAKLGIYYTPGVAAVSRQIAEHPNSARDYTWTNNLIAVISDGSAVLGLGNIGPLAALPVMEGKCMLFKQFGGLDAIPIVLDVHEPAEIIAAIKAIAPSFGGINLEDIAAPACFEIEETLSKDLPIPVMHDDQHGTAVVVLAGLINAAKITGRDIKQSKIVIVGAGAAGVAVAKLLYKHAKPQIIAVDSHGIIYKGRSNLNDSKRKILEFTNPETIKGDLNDAIKDADIFIGVSQPNLLKADHIKLMHEDPIIFALANPEPEIKPLLAKQAGAAIVATGRSDYPNQINNSLAFPGIFRGALDNRVRTITDEYKIAAALAIANLVNKPTPNKIVPSMFDRRLSKAVAKVFKK